MTSTPGRGADLENVTTGVTGRGRRRETVDTVTTVTVATTRRDPTTVRNFGIENSSR
jgi:hypothetical protein